jgi:hypothetical protein
MTYKSGPSWIRTSDQGIMSHVEGEEGQGLTSNVRAPSSAQGPETPSEAAPKAALADLVKALATLSPEERKALISLLGGGAA